MWRSKKRPPLSHFVLIRLVVFKHICHTIEETWFNPKWFLVTPLKLQRDFLVALLEFLSFVELIFFFIIVLDVFKMIRKTYCCLPVSNQFQEITFFFEKYDPGLEVFIFSGESVFFDNINFTFYYCGAVIIIISDSPDKTSKKKYFIFYFFALHCEPLNENKHLLSMASYLAHRHTG